MYRVFFSVFARKAAGRSGGGAVGFSVAVNFRRQAEAGRVIG